MRCACGKDSVVFRLSKLKNPEVFVLFSGIMYSTITVLIYCII